MEKALMRLLADSLCANLDVVIEHGSSEKSKTYCEKLKQALTVRSNELDSNEIDQDDETLMNIIGMVRKELYLNGVL